MAFPVSPSNGTITVVNNKSYQYLTSKNAWVVIRTIGLPGQFTTREYTANGVSNTFTITSGFTANSLIVTENGVLQSPITDYTVSGDTITFVTTPANTTVIQIRELQITGQTGPTGPSGNNVSTVANGAIWLTSNTISSDYTIPTGNNAFTIGPVTINTGNTVTVSSGSRWLVL